MTDVMNTIKSRRSVRAYRPDRLTRERLAEIVEAGTYAPTGHNQQPWHFTVIQDRHIMEEINANAKQKMAQIPMDWIRAIGTNPNADITHGAPVLIIVSGKKGSVTPDEDCVAAMQNMMLAAESMGIGSCWMGFVSFTFADAELMGRLGVPEGYEGRQAAVFGYPSEGAKKDAPPRNPDVANYIGEF